MYPDKKFLKKYIMFLYLVGIVVFTLSNIFRHELSDFQVGFCEGVSIVLILAGFVTIGLSLVKKENPFRL